MKFARLIILCLASLAIGPLANVAVGAESPPSKFYSHDEEMQAAGRADADPSYQEADEARAEAERVYQEALARVGAAKKSVEERKAAALEKAWQEQKVISFKEAFESRCYMCFENFRSFGKFDDSQEMVKAPCCGHMSCAPCYDEAKAAQVRVLEGKDECPMCRRQNPQVQRFLVEDYRKERFDDLMLEGNQEISQNKAYRSYFHARDKYKIWQRQRHLEGAAGGRLPRKTKAEVLAEIRWRENWRRPQPLDELFTFVPIPAGTFNMGSSSEEGHSEYYQHRFDNEVYIPGIRISAFEMQATLMTQFQYFSIEGANPSFHNKREHCPGPGEHIVINNVGICRNLPVERVSYLDAKRALGKLTAASALYTYRLPRSAEWEIGAKAGKSGPFPWDGGQAALRRFAWWANNSGGKTHAVALLEPNAWNLFDMIGNTHEWVEDKYLADRSNLPKIDPFYEGEAEGDNEIRGGGFWNWHPQLLRPARRYRWAEAYNDLGFRVVRTPKLAL